MSITFEYSFNAPLELPELAEAVTRALGSHLERDEDDIYGCELLGMRMILERHDYETDRDLNVADYRYQLWNKTWDGSSMRRIQVEVLVLIAFVLYELVKIGDGMLTYEQQILLARYGVVDGEWCDTTTGEPVEPPLHIVDLLNRLDQRVT